MPTNRDNGPTVYSRGDGWDAHMREVEKGRKSADVLRATADESPLAFDGTTAEKALQTTASVEDLDEKDEGAQVSARASEGKLEAAKGDGDWAPAQTGARSEGSTYEDAKSTDKPASKTSTTSKDDTKK